MEKSGHSQVTFGLVDMDGDGYITPKDIRALFRTMQLFPSVSDVEGIFAELHTAKVSYEQFIAYIKVLYPNSELCILCEFRDAEDRRFKGHVSEESLAQSLRRKGLKASDADIRVDSIFKCDRNADGLINYNEYFNYRKGVIPRE